ncbi:MAG TPA: radical SAM family heme chaperone HemW [Candidatus Dorea intestinavium]|nr:radical SAM family heme chaperone HemW [Candidatus Dorea intestinavium]
MKKELELYLHIPFCVKKCNYCDFPSGPSTKKVQEEYVKQLIKKIEDKRDFAKDYEVSTIFVGGGTPTILATSLLDQIFEKVFAVFKVNKKAEITTEMNPGTGNLTYLKELKKMGINRLSLGLQSTNDLELLKLGRIHTYEDFLRTFKEAREVGFDNINVDLMSAIPEQTIASWIQSLKHIARIAPEHISAYSLIVEEGTPFYEMEQKHLLNLPNEEDERRMYKETNIILKEYGYHRYEISNYAKEGYECQHNLGYWERKEYLGLGYQAASLINNKRFVEGEEAEVLTIKNQMEEFMFLGLRKMVGISSREFYKTFNKEIHHVYGKVLKDLKHKKLIRESKGYIALTEKGIDLSNYVLSEFLF